MAIPDRRSPVATWIHDLRCLKHITAFAAASHAQYSRGRHVAIPTDTVLVRFVAAAHCGSFIFLWHPRQSSLRIPLLATSRISFCAKNGSVQSRIDARGMRLRRSTTSDGTVGLLTHTLGAPRDIASLGVAVGGLRDA